MSRGGCCTPRGTFIGLWVVFMVIAPLVVLLVFTIPEAVSLKSTLGLSDNQNIRLANFTSCTSCLTSICSIYSPYTNYTESNCDDYFAVWSPDFGCVGNLTLRFVNSSATIITECPGDIIPPSLAAWQALAVITLVLVFIAFPMIFIYHYVIGPIIQRRSTQEAVQEAAGSVQLDDPNPRVCGGCRHDKHHGFSCREMITNPNANSCTCNHSHHRGSTCAVEVSYVEYHRESKHNVPVRKSRTKPVTVQERVAVTKWRTVTKNEPVWSAHHYGPNNGSWINTYKDVREQYRDYETKTVTKNETEYYTEYEDQWVDVPVTKYRPCNCDGYSCRCRNCVAQVECSCSACDCTVCRKSKLDTKIHTAQVEVKAQKSDVLFVHLILFFVLFGIMLIFLGAFARIAAEKDDWMWLRIVISSSVGKDSRYHPYTTNYFGMTLIWVGWIIFHVGCALIIHQFNRGRLRYDTLKAGCCSFRRPSGSTTTTSRNKYFF